MHCMLTGDKKSIETVGPRSLIKSQKAKSTETETETKVGQIRDPDKLSVNLFKGFDFTGHQSFHFSHRKLTSPL